MELWLSTPGAVFVTLNLAAAITILELAQAIDITVRNN